MTERREIRQHGVKRTLVTKDRDCALGVISFSNLELSDHLVKILDHSVIGVGIESDRPIEFGIIWFKEIIYGQRCGSLVWCKQIGSRYRAGIQFLSFSREQEEYLRQQIELSQRYKKFQDPQGFIATLIADIKKDIKRSVSDT